MATADWERRRLLNASGVHSAIIRVFDEFGAAVDDESRKQTQTGNEK